MKRLKDVETDEYHLEVYECDSCGFHTGVDATYLEQVGRLRVSCLGCGRYFKTGEYDETK